MKLSYIIILVVLGTLLGEITFTSLLDGQPTIPIGLYLIGIAAAAWVRAHEL